NREALTDHTGDPWGGRTLEWSTSSPPPEYNFAFTPIIHDLDAWYDMKDRKYARPTTGFKAIHMPRGTGTGVFLAGLSVAFGFGMIWYMWWLAGLALVGIFATAIVHSFNYKRDYHIPVEEVIATEAARTRQLAAQGV
ncbi:MAG: cytochrome o ubiquinol oxidase subunit I, partial [Sphingomonas sp.]